ncbi:MAG: glycosyltransferase family 4 protein [Chloroflexi bacterium]|nr:glycosyltransferase family 4 protein [Chloroflexota bacterium]
MGKTLFVVSATYSRGTPDTREGPIKDYVAIADRLDADVLDWAATRQSRVGRLAARVVGLGAAQALLAFLRRRQYDLVLTDGEHIGLPLATLLKLTGRRFPHITIGHRLSSAKKRLFFTRLRVQTHVDAIVLHSRRQYDVAIRELGLDPDQLALVPYQVDPEFWRPMDVPEERLIVSAGLEYRDYPTLFQAVDGLDAQVVVGAASNWSRRRNTALDAPRPSNVSVSSFDYHGLRALFARASVIAVPVDDVDFQAGVTTVLEAMAMGKAVVVTHSYGQTDVIEDRRMVTRGAQERSRPISLLRTLAAEADVEIGPNGFYVPPHDPAALRRALVYLLDHPEDRARLGAAGRRAVERLMRVDQFADRIARVVEHVRQQHRGAREERTGQETASSGPAAQYVAHRNGYAAKASIRSRRSMSVPASRSEAS